MKTIVTVSKNEKDRPIYGHVVIVTSLYDVDGDDLGLASISFDQYGTFSFKVQLRDVANTLPLWVEIYDTLHFGRAKALDVYVLIKPLIVEDEKYHIINNFHDDIFYKDSKTNSGWNAVLKSVDDFLCSIDPEFRILPVIEEEKDEDCR